MRQKLPSWLNVLSQKQVGATEGVRWYTAAEISATWEEKDPDDLPLESMTDTQAQLAEAQYETKLCVGESFVAQDRAGLRHTSYLWIDEEQPDTLLLALSAAYPPFLWIPLGQDLDSLTEICATYFSPTIPAQTLLAGRARLLLGTTDLLDTDMVSLENHFILSPFCESFQWSNAYTTDPYPDSLNSNNMTIVATAAFIRQVPDQAPSTSFRTVHSHSIFRTTDYDGILLADLFYQPAGQNEIVSAFNAAFQADFPLDAPLDLIATLLGLANIDLPHVQSLADAAPDAAEEAGLREVIAVMQRTPL